MYRKRNFIYELPLELRHDLRLYLGNLWGNYPKVPRLLHSKNKYQTLVVKYYAKGDANIFLSCPFLLYFFSSFKIFDRKIVDTYSTKIFK